MPESIAATNIAIPITTMSNELSIHRDNKQITIAAISRKSYLTYNISKILCTQSLKKTHYTYAAL